MKVSIVRPLAIVGCFACIAALQAIPAAAQEYSSQAPNYPRLSEQSQQDLITRAQVRDEYLQAAKEGTLPVSPEAGVFSSTKSATAPVINSLTRQAVLADTIEWMRLDHGDVQMGGQ